MNLPDKSFWKSGKLGDFLFFQRGFDITKKEIRDGDYWVISSSGPHKKHYQFKVKGPGVVIGRKGTLGSVFFSEKDFWPHDTTLWVKDFRGNHPYFAYYFLKTLNLERYDCGASNPTINRNHIHNISITYPPLAIQYKIASILSAYDDLIENNTRRISILEEMAQMIYREWFVKFRFPGHEKVKMVDSPLGKIPEGWEVKELRDILSVLESGSRPKGGVDPNCKEIPSIGAENIFGLGKYNYSKEKYVTEEFFEVMNRGHIKSKDILLYKDGAKIGRKSMFRDGFPHDKCCINEHVFILRTNSGCTQNYLYFWIDQPEMTQNIINLNTNAAQPGINQEKVKGLQILIPINDLLEKVETTLEPLLGLLFNLAKKCIKLRQTRDLLLLKLISGELDVSELDIEIPESDEPELQSSAGGIK